MVSLVLMIRRFLHSLRETVTLPGFRPTAVALLGLIISGVVAYVVIEGWGLVDSLYFAFMTLTTSDVADPALVLTSPISKVFTILYQLVGIGIIAHFIWLLSKGLIAVDEKKRGAKQVKRHEKRAKRQTKKQNS